MNQRQASAASAGAYRDGDDVTEDTSECDKEVTVSKDQILRMK